MIFIGAKSKCCPNTRAGAAHVQPDRFKRAQETLPRHLAETPRIVNVTVPQDDWSELGELAVR